MAYTLLSVDPGYRSGYALWTIDSQSAWLHYCATLTPAKAAPIHSLMRRIEQLSFPLAKKIVVENQYFPSGKARGLCLPPNVIARTAATRDRWETLAEISGWSVEDPIAPQTWQKDVLGLFGRVTRAERKKQAVAVVASVFDLTVAQDTADAVCIGLAYCLHHCDSDPEIQKKWVPLKNR